MSKGVRNVSIDMIKGMAIIFVVLGHCGFPWTDYLYLFHMAVFLMASGYCFSARHGQSLDSFWNYVLKK